MTARPSSACAHVSGSTSSGPSSRPAIAPSRRRSNAVLAASTVVKCTRSSMSSSGSGYAASTTVSRQTSLSSAAASSAAALQAPSTSASPAGARLDSTPMRNAPGFAPTSAANGRAGGAAAYGSPGRKPEMASSTAALSRTERLTTCRTTSPAHASPSSGPSDTRPASRLEAEQTARAGRDADRAAAVARVRERHHARRDRRRAAAARSAGGPVEVPGVAGGPVGVRFGRRQQAELRRVGLAHDHAPGGAQICEQVGVVGGGVPTIAQQPVAEVERFTGEGTVEVLHQHRHAAERTVRRTRRPRRGRARRDGGSPR